MPYTKEELKNYDFYQNLKHERDDRYEAAYNDALGGELIKTSVTEEDPITGETIISTILVPNPETVPRYNSHLVVSGSNTLFSFEGIDEERRKDVEERKALRNGAPDKFNKIAIETSSELIQKLSGAEVNNSSIAAIVDDLSRRSVDKYYVN